VNSDDLTADQLRTLEARVRPMLYYVNRLRKRMDKRGFLADDPLSRRVIAAQNALHELSVHLHYAACEVERRNRDTRPGW
jgi:hypothetical protein